MFTQRPTYRCVATIVEDGQRTTLVSQLVFDAFAAIGIILTTNNYIHRRALTIALISVDLLRF